MEGTPSKAYKITDFKADVGDVPGICEFTASVFGNVDDGRDVVEPGSFQKVVATGRRPKFVPDHNWSVGQRLGKVLEWKEVPVGLWIKGQFNLEKLIARDIYSDMKFAPEDQEFSFSYSIPEGGYEIRDDIRYIKEFDNVFDVGPVGIGMNRSTSLLSVKGMSGSLAGLRLKDHSEQVHAANEEYIERLEGLLAVRAKEGREFSAANLAELDAIIDEMASAHSRAKALRAKVDAGKAGEGGAEGISDEAAHLQLKFRASAIYARALGV